MNRHDFLVEIGAEEMPPKSLPALGTSFRDGFWRTSVRPASIA